MTHHGLMQSMAVLVDPYATHAATGMKPGTSHHGHVPHDIQPRKETLPQPRKITTPNAHGPRNSHRSRVLRGPLEPKHRDGAFAMHDYEIEDTSPT